MSADKAKKLTGHYLCSGKLKCPTCGHAVKYGYIVPVDRNDVLDEAIEIIDKVVTNSIMGRLAIRHAINAIEALKTDNSEQVEK